MTQAITLSEFELERYSRQIRVAGFGLEAQHKLKESTVLISRVGGVGGTIAALLARAGIGRLILAHGGEIVVEYLNRMPLAVPTDVGRPCMDVFVERLRAINPETELVPLAEHVSAANIAALAAEADLIADGAPLFEERYLLNHAAVQHRKPLVMAAMYSTEGYVTAIVPGETPCLRCIYPEKPDYWTHIKVFPAIGPGPSLVGSAAAMEVIKLLTGFGQPLKNILWFFDLETMLVRRLRINRRPDCPVCGSLPNS